MTIGVEHLRQVPEAEEVHEIIAQHVADSQLQKFFKEDSALTQTVASNALRLHDDGRSFPVTQQNVRRLIRLSLYHPVIYCDDSGSMALDEPRSRWDLLRDAVHRIASITTRVLPSRYGISLRFINAQYANKDNIPPSGISNALPTEPSGGTALGTNLKWNVLQPLVYDILQRGDLLQRPLMICIITDGCPDYDDNPTFENAILECRQLLVNSGYEPTAVRFCVNQIGGDEESTSFLEQLRTNTQIQDVVYCTTERLDEKYRQFQENGRFLDDWLLRMLTEPIMHRTGP